MFHKFRVSRTNYALEGYVSIFVEIFVVSHSRKTSWVNLFLLCFGNFPVAKKFMDKRGGYQYFQSDFFCLTVPKIFVLEPFCAMFQKLTVAKKIMGKWGESRSSPESLLSHSAENFPRRESFDVPLFPGTEKVSIRKGGEKIKLLCQKLVVSQ